MPDLVITGINMPQLSGISDILGRFPWGAGRKVCGKIPSALFTI